MPRKTRKAASTSKKETPEKTRRSSRRRARSASEDEESGSERSQEEHRSKNETRKDDAGGSNEGGKGEESGGSDGAWQVRSENGNKGGIPKLKLSLHRPPEISSPTPEPIASPSPRTRRSRRGASPAIKPDDNDVSLPVQDQSSENHIEESISITEKEPDEETAADIAPAEVVTIEVAEACEEMNVQKETPQTLQEVVNDADTIHPVDDIVNADSIHEEEVKCVDEKQSEMEIAEKPRDAEAEVVKEFQQKPEINHEEDRRQTVLVEVDAEIEEAPAAEEDRRRRSASRDSSEERAKQAALRSRFKKKEGSEDGEVIESPERDVPFPARTGLRIKTAAVKQQETDLKPTAETVVPVVRKRRWGSSASKTSKKSSLSISTDVLKEIIPEAKPVALSEVHLSPNGDITMEEGEVESVGRRDSRSEDRPRIPVERKRRLSEESEKDYEEEVESGGEDMVEKRASEAVRQLREQEPAKTEAPARVSMFPKDPILEEYRQKSPSPARNPTSCVLYITNLVRPFTLGQLRDLLARTGNITGEDGFWIDKIKSRCIVRYANEEEAKNTRHALHGVRWPASNPKNLIVEFATEAELKTALVAGQTPPVAPREVKRPSRIVEEVREKEVERKRDVERVSVRDRESRLEKERNKSREEERDRVSARRDDKGRKVEVEPLKRTVRKVTVPVREWDLGKTERGFSPPPPDTSRRFGDYEKEREVEDSRRDRGRDRGRRSSSDEPVRKVKRKSEEIPTKLLLDDLFRKTKATPAIYWLPLTSEQIAVREEMRRKHMAEHEKRIAEMRRKQDGKRRRRSGTRSRSRSPKK